VPTPPADPEFFDGPEAFEKWLEKNADTADEVWVKFAKKATGVTSLDWTGAVEVVLCFGWIDGQVRRIDDDWYVQRFTPRRPKSRWAKLNRVKVEKLLAEGRMRPRGLAEVEKAKADGRWDAAYDPPSTATIPDDLAAALDAAVPQAPDSGSVMVRVGRRVMPVAVPGLERLPAERASEIRAASAELRSEAASVDTGPSALAPMQGTSVAVAVKDGDTVAVGDLIAVCEAMKMENPVLAHRAGVITGLTIAVGDGVTHHAVLCSIV
jgi:uncharacterized protein YdeI (YjbR/CyaY-like superfamily)/biotin carboxyl carrier protein